MSEYCIAPNGTLKRDGNNLYCPYYHGQNRMCGNWCPLFEVDEGTAVLYCASVSYDLVDD